MGIETRFSFATQAEAVAYVAALDISLGFPRVCPADLADPRATLAQRTTQTAVDIERGVGGVWLTGCYPGERTPAGATRVTFTRNATTLAIATVTPTTDPTQAELDAARTVKDARAPRVLTVAEPTRDGGDGVR